MLYISFIYKKSLDTIFCWVFRHANAECQLLAVRSPDGCPGPKPGPGTNKDRNLTLHHGAVSWQRVKEDWLPPSNCLPSSRVVAAADGEPEDVPCVPDFDWMASEWNRKSWATKHDTPAVICKQHLKSLRDADRVAF